MLSSHWPGTIILSSHWPGAIILSSHWPGPQTRVHPGRAGQVPPDRRGDEAWARGVGADHGRDGQDQAQLARIRGGRGGGC